MDKKAKLSVIYLRWWKSLPASKKAELKRHGFDDKAPHEPYLSDDRYRVNDSPMFFNAQISDKYINPGVGQKMPENDIPSELEPEDDAILNEALQRLRCIIHYFLSAMDESSDSQMKLKADIFRIVTGEGNPPPMIVLAKLHGTTKQNISLQCNHLLAQFNLSKSKFMRTNKFPRKSKQKINQSNDGVMNKSLRKGPPTPPGKESL